MRPIATPPHSLYSGTMSNSAADTANLTGTDGADLLRGSDLADTISGGAGDDQLDGGGGNDKL